MFSLLACEIRKCGQGVAPHRIDVSTQLCQALWIEAKKVPGAAPLFFY